MKIEFKNTPKQTELVRAMASSDRLKAAEARQIFANLVGPFIGQVLNEVDTTRMIYKDFTYRQDEDPSIPVEPLLGVGQNHLTVWSQTTAGGLPTNFVYHIIDEIKFQTRRLDSAISWDERYARLARLDVIALFLERLAEEILLKNNRSAWLPVLSVLAAGTNGGVSNVYRTNTDGLFTLADINQMFARMRRQNMSWAGGTPSTNVGKLTDLIVSPEVMGDIRAFAYNPINTTAANKVAITANSQQSAAATVDLPEAQRAAILAGGDVSSIFGVRLHEMLELGVGQKYNTYFDEVAGSTAYTTPAGGGSAVFDGGASGDELIIGLDLTRPAAYRAIQLDGYDQNSTFSLQPDDQWAQRNQKIGYYGHINAGYVVLASRWIQALIK